MNSGELPQSGTVTNLLVEVGKGNEQADAALAARVFGEFRKIAAHYMRYERPGHTLQPTVIADEAFMRLLEKKDIDWKDRAQFFGFAAHFMRQFLSQHARARHAAKRGGYSLKVNLDDSYARSDEKSNSLLALDQALSKLETFSPVQRKVVEMRFYVGLSVEEIAAALEISPRTVKRHWATARLWLYSQMSSE